MNGRTAKVEGTTVYARRPPNPMYGEAGRVVELRFMYGSRSVAKREARAWRQNRHTCLEGPGHGRCVDCLRKDALLICSICGFPRAIGHELDIRLLRRLLKNSAPHCGRTWTLTNATTVLLREIDALKGRIAKLEKR